jgi:uncharacterized protein (TIGR02996 family)
VETIDGLNPDLLAAYDRAPDDLTLIGAMADWAMEHDAPDVAEFMAWVREKGVRPSRSSGANCWGWWFCNGWDDLPSGLWHNMTEPFDRDAAHHQLLRVLTSWLRLSRDTKNHCWKWTWQEEYSRTMQV